MPATPKLIVKLVRFRRSHRLAPSIMSFFADKGTTHQPLSIRQAAFVSAFALILLETRQVDQERWLVELIHVNCSPRRFQCGSRGQDRRLVGPLSNVNTNPLRCQRTTQYFDEAVVWSLAL